MEGTCKFYLPDRYYGFVELSNELGEVVAEFFFHGRRLRSDEEPAKGDTVSFWLDDDRQRGGLMAVDVAVKAMAKAKSG